MADVLFVGVATGGSFVHRTIPRWQPLLRRKCRIRGVDLPLDAPYEAYRELIDGLRAGEGAAGAVVTSHKVRLFEAARELFAELDQVNEELGYFEPRPWHRDNPQKPKVWAKDPSASNLWGIMPPDEMHK